MMFFLNCKWNQQKLMLFVNILQKLDQEGGRFLIKEAIMSVSSMLIPQSIIS